MEAEGKDPAWSAASARGREQAIRHVELSRAGAFVRFVRSTSARVLVAAGVLLLVVAGVLVHEVRRRVWSVDALQNACRDTTESYFISHRLIPARWTPKMTSILGEEVWYFYGHWDVGAQRYEVLCSARLGRAIDDIGYEIGQPTNVVTP